MWEKGIRLLPRVHATAAIPHHALQHSFRKRGFKSGQQTPKTTEGQGNVDGEANEKANSQENKGKKANGGETKGKKTNGGETKGKKTKPCSSHTHLHTHTHTLSPCVKFQRTKMLPESIHDWRAVKVHRGQFPFIPQQWANSP